MIALRERRSDAIACGVPTKGQLAAINTQNMPVLKKSREDDKLLSSRTLKHGKFQLIADKLLQAFD